jgi:hypothetical protein
MSYCGMTDYLIFWYRGVVLFETEILDLTERINWN